MKPLQIRRKIIQLTPDVKNPGSVYGLADDGSIWTIDLENAREHGEDWEWICDAPVDDENEYDEQAREQA